MKTQQSKKFNPNYAAQIVTLKKSIKHPNADRLVIWTIQGCNVITDNVNYSEGDEVVFFPLESQINGDLISFLSLYREKTLNKDQSKSGFFGLSRRIKALKLRSIPSEGFIIKLSSLNEFLMDKTGEKFDYQIGDVFDSCGDIQLCKKYIIRESKSNNQQKKEKKVSDLGLIENQFRLHYDTEKLATNEYILNTGDICLLSSKWHGTSLVSSKLLIKRKLSLLEKISKFLGVKVQETEYDYIYSSRKVVKSVGETKKDGQHFYKEDVWGLAHDRIKHALKDGMSLYCEIVGYLPSGGMIQQGYDYGCKEGNFNVLVYRITTTNASGDVFEWDWASIKNHCEAYEINHVPEYYYGPVNFTLAQLKEKYLERDCEFCNNKVPSEGICFRNESRSKKAFKLKSFSFLERESKSLDKGDVDIESQESLGE
jgi:tRNA-binding EMAP/Myf-like protein